MSERGWWAAGRLLGWLMRIWRASLRVVADNREATAERCVLAVWHGRLLGVLLDQVDSDLVTMASLSGDGALAAGALVSLGLRATRGSTTRGGGEALSEMRRALREGAPRGALTVDGPKGPWRQVHPGVIVLARRLGIPIVPATFSCRRAKVLGSWDHMVAPRPFSTVVVAYGEPWSPERLRGRAEDVRLALAAELDSLTDALDRQVVGVPLWPSS
jgi:lysophospholipid acyltransferase (LPLAT)-like uncharacterized protein